MTDIYPVPLRDDIPGRLLIVARPRGNDWLEYDVEQWKLAGITTVVSLLTPPENSDLNLANESAAVRAAGIQFVSFPISDRGVPIVLEPFEQTVLDLGTRLANGETIALHCRMSIGRAPTMAAAVMTVAGYDPESAFQVLSQARGVPVPETIGQRQWIEAFHQKRLVK
ncbi:hypothetical protein BH11PLA2_BH11PLA2_35540 [soil metagenome]